MKKRSFLALFTVLAVIVGLLAGCSAAPNSAGAGSSMNADKGVSEEFGADYENSAGSSGVLTDRKLIRKIELTAETEDMDALLSQVNQRVSALEGYIESRNIQNGSSYSDSRSRYATLTIRIPADRLDQFIEQVSGVSNIISTTETSDDVTLQYVATESRLKVLQAEEERLLEFLSQAKSVSEMLEIEARLTEVRSELESITSQLKVYDNLVDYGTVTLRIDEVKEYTVIEEEEPTLWQKMGTGFSDSLQNLGRILEALLVFFVSCLPYLIPMAVIGAVVLVIIRLCRKRKK